MKFSSAVVLAAVGFAVAMPSALETRQVDCVVSTIPSEHIISLIFSWILMSSSLLQRHHRCDRPDPYVHHGLGHPSPQPSEYVNVEVLC